MSDILEQINSLTEQFSNLLGEELEKEGPKKPEVTSLDFDPFKYGMLMNKLSKDKHKYLKAMGQAQYDKGSTEEKELVQKKKSKREKKEMKMNDNNSYNEVVSQINSLTEQFSNLFEVEGLGDPASDVPPSTNKIKKDRKTKDGKVELVSVEDELFPYDGNKREQYRQKIIDTINGMIQGTATLEDLLQIVRQKKAPLKEAMELMEDLFSTILKQPEEKQGSLVYKYHQAKNKENAGKDTYTQAKEEEKRKSKEEKGQEKTEQRKLYKGKTKEDWKQGRLMDQIARKAKSLGKVSDPAVTKSIERNQMKKWKSEGFEGAIEILEFLTKNHSDEENPVVKITDKNYKSVSGKHLGGSFNKNQIGNYLVYNKDTDSSYLVTPDNWKKSKIKKDLEAQGKFYEAVEILEELINEVSDKTAQGALDKAKERYNRKGYEASMKLFQGDSKGAIEDGNKAQDEYNKHINMQLRRAKRQGKKLVQDKNDHDSFKIEEAQELLEEIINEVSLKKWKESAKNSYDKRKEIADKSAEADKKSWDNYEKQSKLSPEDEPELFKKAVDQGAIAYKDKKRADHAMGVYANTPDSKHSATKYNKAILNSLKGREDKYVETGKKSDLDRAINTFHLAKLNPVKEAQELSELFDRPDLLNDISMALTNKTIKQHLQNQAKKLLGGKKKKKVACKACEGLEEALRIIEGMFVNDGRGDIMDDITGTKKTGIQRLQSGIVKITKGGIKKPKVITSPKSTVQPKVVSDNSGINNNMNKPKV